MKSAANFLIISSLLFVVVAFEKEFKTMGDDESDDYRRLKYLADCKIVKLKSGDFELLPDETLKVEAFNLTLNKTYFDVTNDSATICKPYYLSLSETDSLVFPHFASTFCLLVCLLFFATHDYDHLYWTIFAVAFVFYTVNAISEYVKGFFQANEFKIPHDLHFMGLQFFFWMSTMACDALMLSPTDGSESSRKSSRVRISTFDLRQVVLFCFIRLVFVFAFMAVLNVTGIWHLRLDSLGNFIRVMIIYLFLGTFNLVSLQIFFRMYTSVEVEQKVLREVFVVCFIFFNIVVFGWFLEYYCIVTGMETCKRFAFQLESGMAFIFIAAGVMRYYICNCDTRKFEEPAIVEKVAKKIKVALAPKHEKLMQMA